MIFTSLDQICRRNLLEKSLPIHYYMQNLLLASACLRELTMDTLKIINTVELPVDTNYMSVDLPTDFTDDLAVAIPAGDKLAPVAKFDSLTPLRYHDGKTGLFIPPPCSSPVETSQTSFGFNTSWFWYWNINDYGEPTGRYFGATGGAKQNGYKVVRERRQIQLTQTFTSPSIVLMYISDGQSASAATQIDVAAFATIMAYNVWKSSPNADNQNSPQGMLFYNERRKLVARLDDLTITDIRTTILNAYTAAIKN